MSIFNTGFSSSTKHGFRRCAYTASAALFLLTSTASRANEWYWSSGFDGTWDDSFIPNWEDALGNNPPTGKPEDGDSAYLVLPYPFFATQPIMVQYRSRNNPTLKNLAIESWNQLYQWYGFGIEPEYTNLTSNNEYIGGSPFSYTYPPGYPAPDPLPEIYPRGEHYQNVGINQVNELLQIGGTEGSTGLYVLESAADGYFGTLRVGLKEIIGAAGSGEFRHNGGVHTVNGTMIIGQGSTGTGTYDLTSGRLLVNTEILGVSGYAEFSQSGGDHEVSHLTLGQNATGEGIYTLTNGELSVISETIAEGGKGSFTHIGGTHYAGTMVVGAQNSGVMGSYELKGGTLDVTNETIGDGGVGLFNQSGGEHVVDNLTLAAQDPGIASIYNFTGGALTVRQVTKVGVAGDAAFYQAAGSSFVAETLEIANANGKSSSSFYQMNGGLLDITGKLVLGGSGESYFYHYDGDVTVGYDESVDGALTIAPKSEVNSTNGGSYQMNGGSLTVNGSEFVSGTFRHAGGSHTIAADTSAQFLANTLNVDSSGSYSISEGSLSAPRIKIASGGTDGGFRQSGVFGSTVSATYLDIGVLPWYDGNGLYVLESGNLNVGDDARSGVLSIGLSATNELGNPTFGSGALQLDGGQLTVKGDLIVGAGGEGSLAITDDEHTVTGSVEVGTSSHLAQVYQTGGLFNVNGKLDVGLDGWGVYRHQSGRNTYTGEMRIEDYDENLAGYELGSAIPPPEPLPNPRLTFYGTEKIGVNKKGSFVHNYGYHTVNNGLILGSQSTGEGNYTLLDGELLVTGTETIGYLGTGVFTQNGGTHTVQGDLVLAHADGATGQYTQNPGGALTVNGNETIGLQGGANFIHESGDHTVNGDLYLGGNSDVLSTESGGVGSYTIQDGNLNVNAVGSKMFLAYSASSQGHFTQRGGSVTIDYMEAATGHNSIASYTLRDGALVVNSEYFGTEGDAEFMHMGGTHTVNQYFELGTGSRSSATYVIRNPDPSPLVTRLEVAYDAFVGGITGTSDEWGEGAIVQDLSNSLVDIGGELLVRSRAQPSAAEVLYSSYELSKGILETGTTTVDGTSYHFEDNRYSLFRQNGGSHIISGNLYVKQGEEIDHLGQKFYGNGGKYHLKGGFLSANSIIIGGYGFDLIASNDDWYHPGRFFGESNLLNEDLVVRVSDATFLNNGVTVFEGDGHSQVIGRVENNGLMAITDTSIEFDGSFINSGKVESQGSDVQFGEIVIQGTGFMTGNHDDVFSVSGDFFNGSLRNVLWDTDEAGLVFNGVGIQNFYLAGIDLGVDAVGYQNNFAWGELIIGSGIDLSIWDGNLDPGAALYVGALGLEGGVDTGSLFIDYILSDYNIYYDPTRPENSYLQGLTFALNGSGFLMPSTIPVPPAVWLFASGLIGLVAVARRKRLVN